MKHYLSLVKFSHTIFALPFAFIGYFTAVQQGHSLTLLHILLILVCMVTARNTAMAFNRYIDAGIDAQNPRTAKRDIPAGNLSKKSVLGFIILNCVAFIVATYFINSTCLVLSPIALLLIMGYSLTKRFTALCHIVLGLSLALAPIGAYIAATANISSEVILMGVIVLTWVAGFDIIYALQDYDFDKQQKLKSIPTLLGPSRSKMLAKALHFITAYLVIYLGMAVYPTWLYSIGAGLFIVLLFTQHIVIKVKGMQAVNLAFFTLNGIASVVYAVFFILSVVY